MRKGQNPAKFVNQVAHPERITVAVLNYIPFIGGFYAQTLQVLKTCLAASGPTPTFPMICWSSIMAAARKRLIFW